MAQARTVVWSGEENFKQRCHLITMGKALLNKHNLGDGTFYANEGLNKRSGTSNEVMYMLVNTIPTFYRIHTHTVRSGRQFDLLKPNEFRVTYTISVDTQYGEIDNRMALQNEPWWIETRTNVDAIRNAIESAREEIRIIQRQQAGRNSRQPTEQQLQRAREFRQQRAQEVQRAREAQQIVQRAQEVEDDILRQAQEALERAQTELRREREMMAQFVEVFAPEPAIVPHPGAQLDLVPTPVPFVPEQPPNA